MNSAVIGQITRGAEADGPGLRTTVFFKGCPLRCPWCHNPELQQREPELALLPERCIGCNDCAAVCPAGAANRHGNGWDDRTACRACGSCAAACPAAARRLIGQRYTVDELLQLLLRDRSFYEVSGGGVTLSGGEPTLWAQFCLALIVRLNQHDVHTAIQTCGAFAWGPCEPLLARVDLILFDVKLADPLRHRLVTGVDNRAILANLQRLLAWRPSHTVVRIPVVPGFTADDANLTALSSLLRQLRTRRLVLLPWHPLGLPKAAAVGQQTNPDLPNRSMRREELERWRPTFHWAEALEL